jgi:hypothetical protein
MTRSRTLVPVGLAILLSGAPAQAGALLVETRDDGSTTRIQIDRDRVRVDLSGTNGPQVIIFRGDRRAFYIIDAAKKTYMEMTRQDVERLASQVGSAMEQMRAQMEQQLRNMTPEQRKMIDEQMKGMGAPLAGQTSASNTVFKRLRSDREGQWACDVYEGMRGPEKVQEVCAADWKALGMSGEDFETIRQIGEFFKEMARSFGANDTLAVGSNDWEKTQGFPGVPVRRVSFSNGAPRSTARVTEARSQSFPDSLFDVPAGFQKEQLPTMNAPRP